MELLKFIAELDEAGERGDRDEYYDIASKYGPQLDPAEVARLLSHLTAIFEDYLLVKGDAKTRRVPTKHQDC